MKKYISCMAMIVFLFPASALAVSGEKVLIASESFSVTEDPGDYTDNTDFNNSVHNATLARNTGFNAERIWQYGSASVRPRHFAGLDHSLLDGDAYPGGVVLRGTTGGLARNSIRRLASRPSGKTFIMSGLVHVPTAGHLNANDKMAMGLIGDLSVNTWDISTGIHLGVYKDNEGDVYLAAFAAGNTYPLGDPLSEFGSDHLIELQLELDTGPGGTDTLNAWIAYAGETNKTHALTVSDIDIGSAADLETFVLQSLGGGEASTSSGPRFDEFRLYAFTVPAPLSLLENAFVSESFSTTESSDDYSDNTDFNSGIHNATVIGNTGFIEENVWQYGSASIRPRHFAGLDHNLLPGYTYPGGVVIRGTGGGEARNSVRPLAERPVGKSFVMSGLVHVPTPGHLHTNDKMAMGLIGDMAVNTWDVSRGIHLGVHKDDSGDVYLAAFAGGNTYTLGSPLSDELGQFSSDHLIVLRLDLDTGPDGSDTLNAWIAYAGDSAMSHELTITDIQVGTVADLRSLVLQGLGGGDESVSGGARFDEFRLSAFKVSESFSVTEDPGDYTDNVVLDDPVHSAALVGNSGFSPENIWQHGTSSIMPRDFIALDHILVEGDTLSGGVVVRGTSEGRARNSIRRLAATPAGKTFYLSGLISVPTAGHLNNHDRVAMGLIGQIEDDTWDVAAGAHMGAYKDAAGDVYLAAFAGGNTYTLGEPLSGGHFGAAHLIVLRVQQQAGSSELDTLDAWIAYAGETILTPVLSVSGIEIGAAEDLGSFVIQSLGGGAETTSSGARFDEFRFGTALKQVTEGHVESGEFYISPTGIDDNPGTADAPFRTLARAREAVRSVNQYMGGDIFVNIAAGDYRLEEAEVFSWQDSGFNGHRVVYRSRDGIGAARILGSEVLTGWTLHDGDIWKVSVEEDWVFHTLYENGQRAHKARFPSYQFAATFPSARGPYLTSESGSGADNTGDVSWIVYETDDFDPSGWSIGNLKINVFPWAWRDWHRWILPVTGIDPATRTLTFDNLGDGTLIGAEARYFLEDHPALLDAPGEFYLDTEEWVLYYIPIGSGHPDQLNIAAPRVLDVLRLEGTEGSEIADITFEGLYFGETDGLSPTLHWWTWDWGMTDHAAIWMNLTRGIHIRNCHIINSGRHGILMAGGNIENVVEGSLLEQMGVTGIKISNRRANHHGPGQGPAYPSERHVLTNNRMHDVGQLSLYASSIGIHSSSENEVSYSDLYNSPRYAVTVRGNTTGEDVEIGVHESLPPARDNHFHHLRIYECGHDSGDAGALHAAGVNIEDGTSINVFEQILVDTVQAVPGMNDLPPDGIFLDWPSRTMHQVFKDIHITNVQGEPFRSHGADNEESAVFENVSWLEGFDEAGMEYELIGVQTNYPVEFGGHSLGVLIQSEDSVTFPQNSLDLYASLVEAPHMTFTGTAAYAWMLISGPGGAEFTETDTAATRLVVPEPGVYEVGVQVVLDGYEAGQTKSIVFAPYPMQEPAQSYEDWADAQGLPEGERDYSDDPYDSGIPNLIAYATGLPPDVPGLTALHITESEGRLILSIPWRIDITSGIYFSLETSEELSAWRTAGGLAWDSIPLDSNRVELQGSLPFDLLPALRFYRVRFGFSE